MPSPPDTPTTLRGCCRTRRRRYLWRQVVGDALSRTAPLVDAAGAAALAAEAWARMHAFGAGGRSWQAWSSAAFGEDAATFARWAERYAQRLRETQAIDLAQTVDRLLGATPSWTAFAPSAIALAGFVEPTPQQERLLAALGGAGVEVTRLDTVRAECGRSEVVACATPRDELASALHWARGELEAAPQTAIGIVVLDLAARREEVRSLAEDILCPELQWPGREGAVRPYELSLGTALADVPSIAVALDLLALTDHALPADRAAALLRSPYLPGDEAAWLRRAGAELRWRGAGVERVERGALAHALAGEDPALAQRWRGAFAALGPAGRAPPRAWCDAWRALLFALGWPGARALDSGEHQALGAWDEALAEFATLDAVCGHISRGEALAALDAQLADTLFQPQGKPAPIEILGVLEAAGLPFDALWAAGFAADAWPQPPRPNPLLPLSWQRERGVPRSSAARELEYARALVDVLARSARRVVFSHPQCRDDCRCEASALVGIWPQGAPPIPLPTTAQAAFAARPELDGIDDGLAPAVPPGTTLRGGAGLIEAQGNCPFQAIAAHRLGAAPWPRRREGLTPQERGSLAHLALAAFWRRVGDQRTLLALDPPALGATIEDAVCEAMQAAAIGRQRWAALPAVLAPAEQERLCGLLRAWLERAERGRPEFVVSEIESPIALAFEGFRINARLDRVDVLADGSVAIIDYKTGTTAAVGRWFEARPLAPQLGVYLLARRAANPHERIGALAYAQLAPDALEWVGIAADADLFALRTVADATGNAIADWPAAEAAWRAAITALAAEIAAGVATVQPRVPGETCRRCGRQSLCRIGDTDAGAAGEGG